MNIAETKIKEYIEQAIIIGLEYKKKYDNVDILVIAQMLQREEHFNNLNNK